MQHFELEELTAAWVRCLKSEETTLGRMAKANAEVILKIGDLAEQLACEVIIDLKGLALKEAKRLDNLEEIEACYPQLHEDYEQKLKHYLGSTQWELTVQRLLFMDEDFIINEVEELIEKNTDAALLLHEDLLENDIMSYNVAEEYLSRCLLQSLLSNEDANHPIKKQVTRMLRRDHACVSEYYGIKDI